MLQALIQGSCFNIDIYKCTFAAGQCIKEALQGMHFWLRMNRKLTFLQHLPSFIYLFVVRDEHLKAVSVS